MSILVDSGSAILVHGIDRPLGLYQCHEMVRYGTNLIGAIDPSKTVDIPPNAGFRTFLSLEDALARNRVDALMVFDEPLAVRDTVLKAFGLGIKLVICLTEYVPVHDSIVMVRAAKESGSRLIGPNSAGLLTPDGAKCGFFSRDLCIPGRVGVVTKGGSLAYATISEMRAADIGVSTVVAMGGDAVKGSDFGSMIELFEQDPQTDVIVMLGEVGGGDEEKAAELIARKISKPVVAFISGRALKPGQNVGHAGAIVRNGRGDYASKIRAMRGAGMRIVEDFSQIVPAIELALRERKAS
jgi:succinyl-CoA synthetase alpha subunit